MAGKLGVFAGLNKSWKLIILLSSCLPLASLMEIKVLGPDTGLEGDYERFTCVFEGEDVNPASELVWKYKMKNGEISSVSNSDMLGALEARSNLSGKLTVASFIRLMSIDVAEIVCQHSPQSFSSKAVAIGDLKSVASDDDLCSKATGNPLTIMQTTSMDLVPPYRRSRYLNGESVSVVYPTEVSQVQLTCISSKNGDAPIWSMKKEEASKMKFAVWAQYDLESRSCRKQTIHIYEVQGQPGETVKFSSLQCASGSSYSAPVDLTFKFSDIPTTRQIDFNKTENCVNEVVEQFYNKELTGVGVASSFVIVLMMVGMAMLKKQLNNQQHINKEMQGQGNQGNPNNGSNNGGNNSSNDNQGSSPAVSSSLIA